MWWAGARKMWALAGEKSDRLLKALRRWAEPKGHFTKLQWGIIGAVPVVLALAWVATHAHRQQNQTPPPPPVSEYPVEFQSNVPGAKYLVDKDPPASKYRAGTQHTVTAEMPGYKPASRDFTLPSGLTKSPYVVSLQLEPELIRLELTSDLKSGKVSLDGGPPEDLKDGTFDKDGIALSIDHTFSLTQAGTESLEFSFRAEPGKIVTLPAPPKAKEVKAWVIANLDSIAHVYASDLKLKAGPKDHAEPIPADGLDLGAITADTWITIDDGKSPQTFSLKAAKAPTLTILLGSDPNSANVHLEVLPPGTDVLVSVDRRSPIRPRNSYLGLLAGSHNLHFTAEGYVANDQKVDLNKGQRFELRVEMKPIVRTATLLIDGATPQAEVLVDGGSRGAVNSDGSFRRDDLSPGQHTITLQRPEFETKQLQKTFTAGQQVHISGTDGQSADAIRLLSFSSGLYRKAQSSHINEWGKRSCTRSRMANRRL